MIIAIADDLTGAAEIAGLGWRHGLTADILHRDADPTQAGLPVYDTDSRNCSAVEARRRVKKLLERLRRSKPEWIYKKVDSVLRGNIVAEIGGALDTLELERCLLVPANPSAGRCIAEGRYLIHGTPIHQTDFRNDPRHPRQTNLVLHLLGRSRSRAVAIACPGAKDVPTGIVVGEAANVTEVRGWARRVDEHTLPAGGAEFFGALLRRHELKRRSAKGRAPLAAAGNTMFVCGSMAETAARFLTQSRHKGWPVLLMPETLRRGGSASGKTQARWADEIVAALERNPRVVTGIGGVPIPGRPASKRLGERFIKVIGSVLERAQPDRVCVEGGATAALLLERMSWRQLRVEHEYAVGVVAARPREAPGLLFVCKPGSYSWPAALAR